MKKFSKQQWLVLIGACMFTSAVLGILVNTYSLFFAQMKTEFGITMTRIASHNTIRAVVGALTGIYSTSFFYRTKHKKMFFFVTIASISLGYTIIALDPTGMGWYIGSVLVGTLVGSAVVCLSSVLAKWFPDNKGLVTGIATSFSGVAGVILNPVAGSLIGKIGVVNSLLCFAVLNLTVGTIGTILVFPKAGDHFFEEDSQPAAKTKKGFAGVTIPHLIPRFIYLVLIITGSNVMLQFIFNVSVFAQSVGYSLAQAASIASFVMVGNITGKLIFGALADRFDALTAVVLVGTCLGSAVLVYIFFANVYVLFAAFSVFYGFGYCFGNVGLARCAARVYGEKGQKSIVGIHVSITQGVGAVISLLIGMVYDKFGSFNPVLWIGFASYILMMIGVFGLRKLEKQDGALE